MIEDGQTCHCVNSLYAREIAHRTANAFQNAIAAIQLIHRGTHHVDEVIDRLSYAATLHRLLGAAGGTLSNVSEILPRICAAVVGSSSNGDDVLLDIDCAELLTDIERTRPILMIAAELVGNSVKHAFKSGTGAIFVMLSDDGFETRLLVQDNGSCEGWSRPEGQGRGIVDALAAMLGGCVERTRTGSGSSSVLVRVSSVAAIAEPPSGNA